MNMNKEQEDSLVRQAKAQGLVIDDRIMENVTNCVKKLQEHGLTPNRLVLSAGGDDVGVYFFREPSGHISISCYEDAFVFSGDEGKTAYDFCLKDVVSLGVINAINKFLEGK